MPVIRIYLKSILLTVFIFLVLSLTARALGTTQPPNPALRGFSDGCENQPQPCWNGIVPDLTTRKQADAILGSIGYTLYEKIEIYGGKYMNSYRSPTADCYLVILYSTKEDAPIEGPVVSCFHVQLGDAAALFGAPTNLRYLTRDPNVWFGDHIEGRMFGSESWTSFYRPVSAFGLSTATLSSLATDDDRPPIRWRGIVSRKRYCQLEYVWHYCVDFPQQR